MIRGSPCYCRSGSVKAEITKIKLIDEDIDYAYWIVVGHIVLKVLRQQNSLLTVCAFDASLHLSARPGCVTPV